MNIISSKLKDIQEQFHDRGVNLVNNEFDVSRRMLAGTDHFISTFDGANVSSYTVTFPIRFSFVPFDVITKIKFIVIDSIIEKRLDYLRGEASWIDRLSKVEILCNDKVIAEMDSITFQEWYNIIIPFRGYLVFQNLSIKLTIQINENLPESYFYKWSPWLRDDRWAVQIEGGNIEKDCNHFDWTIEADETAPSYLL